MRKLLAVLAACFLLLGGAGCQFLWPNAPTSSRGNPDKHGAYAGEYTGKWCYQRLNYPDAGMLRRQFTRPVAEGTTQTKW